MAKKSTGNIVRCAALFIVLFFLEVSLAFAQSAAKQGEQIFYTKCTTCHTIGGGKKVGPDLKGVTKTRSKSWLASFISDQDHMLRKKDPATMKLLKQYRLQMPPPGLTPEQVKQVIAYLDTQT